MRIPPPALPPRLVDEREDTPDRVVESTWDALATAAIATIGIWYGERVRVRWRGYSPFVWCCWRPMRLGGFDTQKQELTFGWQRDYHKFAACGRCGRIRDMLF